jgi:uncharacterized protein DUF5615
VAATQRPRVTVKLLLDEHVSSAVAAQLRRRGHDVITAADAKLEQTPDLEILVAATRSRRAVVTANHHDFRPIHTSYIARGQRHFGLILVPRHAWLATTGLGRLVNALDSLLRANPEEDAMDTTEVWLSAD